VVFVYLFSRDLLVFLLRHGIDLCQKLFSFFEIIEGCVFLWR